LFPGRVAHLAEDSRPAVRFAIARGLAGAGGDPQVAAAVLVGVLADADADSALRALALDLTDADGHDDDWQARLSAPLTVQLGKRLRSGQVTAELMWALAAHGRAEDIPLAAAHAGGETVDLANAALEAVAGILNRGVELGEYAAATRDALAASRERLRAEHPLGDNGLADKIVARIEVLEKQLG
jgi:hypothetical protein